MNFVEQAFDDAMGFNLSSDGPFSEPVTYRPRTGAARAIQASLVRNPPATPAELSRGFTPSMMITVLNDATRGISAAELDTGGDAILLAQRLGDATSAAILLPPPDSQDAATLTFRIGKRA